MSAALETGVRCSVIVATRDRPAELRRLLDAVRRQSHPAELVEVVVVDDGSEVPVTLPAGSERLVAGDGMGPARARNAGAALAPDCELLVFADDDSTPSPGWLSALAAAHREQPDAALGGPIAPLHPANPYSAAYARIDEAARLAHSRADRTHFPAANLAVPASRFAEVGGFDETLPVSEDRDFCHRWEARGWPMKFVAEAAVTHSHPETLGAYWSTFLRYGRGAYLFHANRKTRQGVRTSLSTIWFALKSGRSLRQAGLTALWQAATIAGYSKQALRGRAAAAAGGRSFRSRS